MSCLVVFLTIAVLAIAWLSGHFTAMRAIEKGRSSRAWFAWGALLFPLFPLPWVILTLLPTK